MKLPVLRIALCFSLGALAIMPITGCGGSSEKVIEPTVEYQRTEAEQKAAEESLKKGLAEGV